MIRHIAALFALIFLVGCSNRSDNVFRIDLNDYFYARVDSANRDKVQISLANISDKDLNVQINKTKFEGDIVVRCADRIVVMYPRDYLKMLLVATWVNEWAQVEQGKIIRYSLDTKNIVDLFDKENLMDLFNRGEVLQITVRPQHIFVEPPFVADSYTVGRVLECGWLEINMGNGLTNR